MKRFIGIFVLALAAIVVGVLAWRPQLVPGGETLALKMQGKWTTSDRLAQFGDAARARLQPHFAKAGVLYPPHKVVLVGLKREKRLELYAANEDGKMKFVRDYEVLAASGHAGPKLRRGDFQVPEGFCKIESLNPNSAFHVALRVSYPNEFDRQNATREGREDLGGDIMIHGSNASIGCLAMGDEAAEDLFAAVALCGSENVEVLLCPADFRAGKVLAPRDAPRWTSALYARLAQSVRRLPEPHS